MDKRREEIVIYSKGHKIVPSNEAWKTKTKAAFVNIMFFIGVLVILLLNVLGDVARMVNGGVVLCFLCVGIIIWRLGQFYLNSKKHVITFAKNGISVKEPKIFTKEEKHSFYAWEDIVYMTWLKTLGIEQKAIFLDKNYTILFTVDHDVYDFAKEDIIKALSLSPVEIKDISFGEFERHLPWWRRRIAIYTILILLITTIFLCNI